MGFDPGTPGLWPDQAINDLPIFYMYPDIRARNTQMVRQQIYRIPNT